MKLPSLPRVSMPAGRFSPGNFSWRNLLLGAALFVLAFLLGFVLMFPTAPLKGKLVEAFKRRQITAEVDSLTLSPLLALQGRQMTLRPDSGSLPPLTIDRFTIRPLWLSLLSADPGLNIDAELLQGNLHAAVRRSGRLDAEAGGLNLVVPLAGGIATLTGTLSSGQLQWAAVSSQAERSVALVFGDLIVQSPMLTGTADRPLAIGQLTVEASGQGQSLRIKRLESRGGDMGLSGTGSLLLGSTPESTRLNLDLTLRPAATFPGGLKGLLELVSPPAGDGSYPLKISGTLGNPVLQPQNGPPGNQALSTPGTGPLIDSPSSRPDQGITPGIAPAIRDQGGMGTSQGPAVKTFGNKRRRSGGSSDDDD
jgi:type II secretion system protein N